MNMILCSNESLEPGDVATYFVYVIWTPRKFFRAVESQKVPSKSMIFAYFWALRILYIDYLGEYEIKKITIILRLDLYSANQVSWDAPVCFCG